MAEFSESKKIQPLGKKNLRMDPVEISEGLKFRESMKFGNGLNLAHFRCLSPKGKFLESYDCTDCRRLSIP